MAIKKNNELKENENLLFKFEGDLKLLDTEDYSSETHLKLFKKYEFAPFPLFNYDEKKYLYDNIQLLENNYIEIKDKSIGYRDPYYDKNSNDKSYTKDVRYIIYNKKKLFL